MARMTSIEIAKYMANHYHIPMQRTTLRAFADVLVVRKYKKGAILLPEGEVCSAILFVEKGLLRQFYFKNNKDLTEHLAYEGGIVICLESYLKEEPTRLSIEALESCIVWEIPKSVIEQVSLENPEIGLLYRRIFEESLIVSQVKADGLRFETAAVRYQKLASQHPEIIRRSPALYIASLLQMSPETLSRVRASSTQD